MQVFFTRAILLMIFCVPLLANAQSGSERIQLNQVGFYPQAPKVAVVTGATTAERFYVINAKTKDTVFGSTLGTEKRSAYSSTVTRLANFSALKKNGKFYISVPGVGDSYPFTIAAHALHQPAVAALKGFFLSVLIFR